MIGTPDGQRPTDSLSSAPWPTAKQRTGVQSAVRALLDALAPERAPERVPGRAAEMPGAVQRYRSPRGCILQGEARAVSVSWFPGAATDESLGELQVIVWSGVVSRPGATMRVTAGARPVAEDQLFPVETPADRWAWRAADGRVLDAPALVARCHELLTREAGSARPDATSDAA